MDVRQEDANGRTAPRSVGYGSGRLCVLTLQVFVKGLDAVVGAVLDAVDEIRVRVVVLVGLPRVEAELVEDELTLRPGPGEEAVGGFLDESNALAGLHNSERSEPAGFRERLCLETYRRSQTGFRGTGNGT
jgi:hypothetical protein